MVMLYGTKGASLYLNARPIVLGIVLLLDPVRRFLNFLSHFSHFFYCN